MLGYLPQDFGLYPTLTVAEQLDYMAVLCDLGSARERKEAVERCLQQVNMLQFSSRRVGGLSGGMRQRLGIAQALLNQPRLLIIDEPTAGLDPEERIRIRSLLAELGGHGIVILSTHIVADVEATADRVCVLRFGDNLFTGTVDELVERVRGRVWVLDVEAAELSAVKERYTFTGVYRTQRGLEVRAGDEVTNGARQVGPTWRTGTSGRWSALVSGADIGSCRSPATELKPAGRAGLAAVVLCCAAGIIIGSADGATASLIAYRIAASAPGSGLRGLRCWQAAPSDHTTQAADVISLGTAFATMLARYQAFCFWPAADGRRALGLVFQAISVTRLPRAGRG